MQSLGIKLRPESRSFRRWIYALLAILSAAVTTWALQVTQEMWRPPDIAKHESQSSVETSSPEIEALEAELMRIQRRLDELRSSTSH